MKKSMILSAFLMLVFIAAGTTQAYLAGSPSRVAGIGRPGINAGPRQCKKIGKWHKRQMRRMAHADGKVTPRERRLLRRQNRRSF